MVQVKWLKVYTDIFDNEKMKKLLRNRDGDTYFRVWIQLLTLAAKSNQHGAILLGENIPMSKEDLAKVMHKTLNKLDKIIQDLHKLDMIIVEKDTIAQYGYLDRNFTFSGIIDTDENLINKYGFPLLQSFELRPGSIGTGRSIYYF